MDSELLAHVRPAGWTNPKPRGIYNLVVVGGGTAGLVSTAIAAGLGARVALVERFRLGGDCLNVGCVPSKALLAAARTAASANSSHRFGVSASPPEVDFQAVMQRMRRVRADLAAHDSADRFRQMGVDVFFGQGRFQNSSTLEVDGQTLRFKRAILATGSRPTVPPIPGLEPGTYLTNETLFDLTELPRRMLVIGGGPIGCEMAQCFARLGSKVTLVEKHTRVLHNDDRDASEIVGRIIERDGVDIRRRANVNRIERAGGMMSAELTQAGSRESEPEHVTSIVPCDAILVAVGRTANVDSMGLDQAGVRTDAEGRLIVDHTLRTTNGSVFAAGDVASHYRFTHAADAQARVAIRNALFPFRTSASSLVIPWCTYCSPEVAHVGVAPSDAQKRDDVATYRQPLDQIDRAALDGADEGFVKVHCRRGSDKIVGGTIVAPHAGDLIGYITLAMNRGIGLRHFSSMIYPYPTLAEAMRKIGDQYQRQRLSPRAARWLGRWFAMARR